MLFQVGQFHALQLWGNVLDIHLLNLRLQLAVFRHRQIVSPARHVRVVEWGNHERKDDAGQNRHKGSQLCPPFPEDSQQESDQQTRRQDIGIVRDREEEVLFRVRIDHQNRNCRSSNHQDHDHDLADANHLAIGRLVAKISLVDVDRDDRRSGIHHRVNRREDGPDQPGSNQADKSQSNRLDQLVDQNREGGVGVNLQTLEVARGFKQVEGCNAGGDRKEGD